MTDGGKKLRATAIFCVAAFALPLGARAQYNVPGLHQGGQRSPGQAGTAKQPPKDPYTYGAIPQTAPTTAPAQNAARPTIGLLNPYMAGSAPMPLTRSRGGVLALPSLAPQTYVLQDLAPQSVYLPPPGPVDPYGRTIELDEDT